MPTVLSLFLKIFVIFARLFQVNSETNYVRNSDPKVTVLMPVYNGEKYLREAIEGILNQTFADFEFLIINDGSTDRSVEIIESYDDPRIRLVHNEKNLKLAATLNKGLQLAGGEYIARMDCDDISLPARLEKQVEFMDAHPDVGVLGSGFQVIDGEGKNMGLPTVFPSEHSFFKWCLHFYSPVVHPSVMMRKKVVLETGGYSSKYIHAEDYDIWWRASKITKISNLQENLLFLRKHDENVTKTYFNEHFKNTAIISQLMISQRLGYAVPLNVVDGLKYNKFDGLNVAIEGGRVVVDLYNSFVNNIASPSSIVLIRKDAAVRLLNAVRPYIRNYRTWKMLIFSFYLSPQLMINSAIGLICRIIRRVVVAENQG